MNNNVNKLDEQNAMEPCYESRESILVVVEGEEDTTERPMRETLRKNLETQGVFATKPRGEDKKGQG